MDRIKKILILIVIVLVLIITLITITRRGKGKEIKDKVTNIGEKIKEVANNTTDLLTDNVAKGAKGAGNALNNVSNFIESGYFFEEDKVQSIATSLLLIIPILYIWITSINERKKGTINFKDLLTPSTITNIFVIIFVTLIVELVILIFFLIGGLITKKNGDLLKVIGRVFKSRFYFCRPIKITIIRVVLYLVVMLFCFVILRIGVINIIFCAPCKGSIAFTCINKMSLFI